MAKILVTPETLRGKATNVRAYREQHDTVIANLKTLVAGLNETWAGNAHTTFVDNFNGMESTFTQFSEMLEEYAKEMDAFANKMEENDHL